MWRIRGLQPLLAVFIGQDHVRKSFGNSILGKFDYVSTNQAVGGSNPSGRAILNKGLQFSVGPFSFQRSEIVASSVTHISIAWL